MMDKEYFLNAGISPSLPFESTVSTGWNGLNCTAENTFLDPNWDASCTEFTNFDSVLSSLGSSPVASNSGLPPDNFAFREVVRKLGGISSSGHLSPAFPPVTSTAAIASVATPFSGTNSNSVNNNSCTSTPLSSPAKLQMPIFDQMNTPNLGNSLPLPPLPCTDPGFAERAAKFSCFGSRSFNGRTNPFALNNAELQNRSSTPMMGVGKLPRVSSSPSLKQTGSPLENKNLNQKQMEITPVNVKMSKLSESGANSNESSVSGQIPSGETVPKASNELNSRKRKTVSRGKSKEDAAKGVEDGGDDTNPKRSKPTEGEKNENHGGKAEEEAQKGKNNGGDESEKQNKGNQKPPEPPKDYIHVRARRGQATDSHSLAERVRREKISERMKLLQDLVPGCNKVTGKALMLDEIINYVQSLQRQVEFLSMKLASVNPRLDFNMDNLLSKDIFQQNQSVPHQMYPLDSSAQTFYNHHQHQPQPQPESRQQLQQHQLHHNISMDPLDTPLCRVQQLPQFHGFHDSLPQLPPFSEDDLQSIVQRAFSQSPTKDSAVPAQNFSVADQSSHMKIEL